MTEQKSPEQRAADAAEALAAEGAPVTARAVRERSGVRMTQAAEAARAWNEREAQAEAVPEPPAPVEARFAAIWREAVLAARGEFAEARVGWQSKLEQAEAEREALAKELEQAEAERDRAQEEAGARLEAAQQEAAATREHAERAAAAAAEELAAQRSRADKAESRAEAVEGERDRLLAERDELRDAIRKQKD